jgi:hypothetical protein
VHADSKAGPREVARDALTTPGRPSIDDAHYPPRPAGAIERKPRARSADKEAGRNRNAEIIDTVHARRAPVIPPGAGLRQPRWTTAPARHNPCVPAINLGSRSWSQQAAAPPLAREGGTPTTRVVLPPAAELPTLRRGRPIRLRATDDRPLARWLSRKAGRGRAGLDWRARAVGAAASGQAGPGSRRNRRGWAPVRAPRGPPGSVRALRWPAGECGASAGCAWR